MTAPAPLTLGELLAVHAMISTPTRPHAQPLIRRISDLIDDAYRNRPPAATEEDL